MTNEKVIMDKDDYHTARGILKTAISNDAEGYEIEDEPSGTGIFIEDGEIKDV